MSPVVFKCKQTRWVGLCPDCSQKIGLTECTVRWKGVHCQRRSKRTSKSNSPLQSQLTMKSNHPHHLKFPFMHLSANETSASLPLSHLLTHPCQKPSGSSHQEPSMSAPCH